MLVHVSLYGTIRSSSKLSTMFMLYKFVCVCVGVLGGGGAFYTTAVVIIWDTIFFFTNVDTHKIQARPSPGNGFLYMN